MSKLNSDLQALVARFEEGVPADPTKNMDPEDAAKWQAMNDEHGDKFKTAAGKPGDVWETPAGNWRGTNAKGQTESFETQEKAKAFAKGKGPGPDRAERARTDRVVEHGKKASDILRAIHRGDKVTITTAHGQQATGTAALLGPHGWVLNMGAGGARTAIATNDNIVNVKPAKRSAHVYLVGVNHNKEPMVDGHFDPTLMGMILTKITGMKVQPAGPNKAILETSHPSTRTVSVAGILTTWDKALKAALLENADMFKPAGRDSYRVEVNVGPIYEKGMKAADGEDAKEGKFEEGTPADPTRNMSPEDAAEWKRQNDANKDKFKTSALDHLAALDLELTASSLPGVPEAKAAFDLDTDAAAMEQVLHLAQLDRVADEMTGRIILDQMGGARRLQVMLGVQHIQFLSNGVGIKWPNKTPSKGNYVEIRLNGSDLYDMSFFNVGSMTKKLVKKYDGVYAEDLKDIFEKQTGWYLRMASEQAHLLVSAATREDGALARFEEGKPADPTKDMSPEDAAEWKKNTEEHKDDFKTAAARPYTKDHHEYSLARELAFNESLAELKAAAKDGPDAQQLAHYKVTEEGWKRAVAEALAMAKDKKASDGILAEGCPDNLDEGECKEWEANTEKYQDVVKDQAKEASRRPTETEFLKKGAIVAYKGFHGEDLTAQYVPGFSGGNKAPSHLLIKDAHTGRTLSQRIVPEHEAATFYMNPDLVPSKTAYEEGSRVPDGWDNGHIENKPVTDEPGEEGSDTPDGNGNQHKRAGTSRTAEVVDTMFALVTEDGYMLGATDDPQDAHNKAFWLRTVDTEHFESGAKIMPLTNVPMSLAEKFKDMGTTAQRFSDGYQAWDAAKRFSKGLGTRLASAEKEAGTGLYGHTKRVQADCESCVRRVQKTAAQIAKKAYSKHEGVAEFLSVHAKRAESLPAQILVAALGQIGPKVARQMRLAELRDRAKVGAANVALWDALTAKEAQVAAAGPLATVLWEKLGSQEVKLADLAPLGLHFADVLTAAEALKTAGLVVFEGIKIAKVTDGDSQTGEGVTQTTDKTARAYGLYGFGEKVAQLGLQACTELRHEAGKTAYDLHSRRTAHHAAINDFFSNHSKQAKCMYSRLLAASYPDLPKGKTASVPTSVQGWLEWGG